MRKSMLKSLVVSLGLALVASPVAAKTLVYCSEASPEGFDPALYTTGTTFDASAYPVYSRLLEFINGSTDLQPGLAEKWDISDDGLEYTFHIRPNVKFHTTSYFKPTRTLNADDVIFSFERQGQKDNPWHTYAPGVSYEYYAGMGTDKLIKEIVKVDDLTVKIILNHAHASFLADIAMPHMSIISKEYAEQLGKANKKAEFNQKPIGTGPFVFQGYQKDAVIRYKLNPEYWGPKAKLDSLVFSITPDPMVRLQKLKSGECMVDAYPQISSLEQIKADKKLKVMSLPGLNVAYLSFNTTLPPFDKLEVRQTLSMAIDRNAMIEGVFRNTGIIANNPIPPTIWSYKKDIQPFTYDVEKAKKLLADAGVKDLKVKIMAMPVSRPYIPNARRAAELMQSDLAKIGVKADVISYEWGEYINKAKEKDRNALLIMGWTGDNGDPDNFMATLLSCQAAEDGGNYSFWCDKEYNDLVVQAAKEQDKEARTKLYEQAQQRFRDQYPWLPLAHSTIYQAMSVKIKGFKVNPLGSTRFESVDIED